MNANASVLMAKTNVERLKAVEKIYRAFRLAKEGRSPIWWRLYLPVLIPASVWLASGWRFEMKVVLPTTFCVVLTIFALIRAAKYRDYWSMLFDLLAAYEPQAPEAYGRVQKIVKAQAWPQFEEELLIWYAAENAKLRPESKPTARDAAANRFANKRVPGSHTDAWQARAYPLQQIEVRLQGTRHSEREHVIDQLHAVLARLQAGETTGVQHDDDFGYSFRMNLKSEGPSFFDEPCGSA